MPDPRAAPQPSPKPRAGFYQDQRGMLEYTEFADAPPAVNRSPPRHVSAVGHAMTHGNIPPNAPSDEPKGLPKRHPGPERLRRGRGVDGNGHDHQGRQLATSLVDEMVRLCARVESPRTQSIRAPSPPRSPPLITPPAPSRSLDAQRWTARSRCPQTAPTSSSISKATLGSAEPTERFEPMERFEPIECFEPPLSWTMTCACSWPIHLRWSITDATGGVSAHDCVRRPS